MESLISISLSKVGGITGPKRVQSYLIFHTFVCNFFLSVFTEFTDRCMENYKHDYPLSSLAIYMYVLNICVYVLNREMLRPPYYPHQSTFVEILNITDVFRHWNPHTNTVLCALFNPFGGFYRENAAWKRKHCTVLC